MGKIKKSKSGKIKRYSLRTKLGVKQGFGKPWSARSRIFRVEFSWENPDGSEENFQTHWIECRKFEGEEKQFILAFYKRNGKTWRQGETLESHFVSVYAQKYLVQNQGKIHFNQAFVFPAPKKHNETIRQPLHIVKAIDISNEVAECASFNQDLELVLKNSVYHHKS